MKKESDEASRRRLADLEEQIGELEAEYADLEEVWKAEKASLQGEAQIKEELERAKLELEKARRAGDLPRMAELQYGRIPELESRSSKRCKAEREAASSWCATRSRTKRSRRSSRSGPAFRSRRCSRARRTSCCAWRSSSSARVVGQSEALHDGRERDPPLARRARRSEPAERLVPVPRAHGRRQDGAHESARRVPVRHGRGDGPDRHVRVHGEAFRRAPDRRAAGLRRLRGGRLSHGSRAPQAVLGRAARRGGEGASRRFQRAAAGARRRPADGRAGPHRRFPQYRDRHDLEPG